MDPLYCCLPGCLPGASTAPPRRLHGCVAGCVAGAAPGRPAYVRKTTSHSGSSPVFRWSASPTCGGSSWNPPVRGRWTFHVKHDRPGRRPTPNLLPPVTDPPTGRLRAPTHTRGVQPHRGPTCLPARAPVRIVSVQARYDLPATPAPAPPHHQRASPVRPGLRGHRPPTPSACRPTATPPAPRARLPLGTPCARTPRSVPAPLPAPHAASPARPAGLFEASDLTHEVLEVRR